MILVQTVYFYFSYGFPIFFKVQFTSNLIFFPNWSLVYDKKKTNKKHYCHSDLLCHKLLILYVRLHHYKESFLFYICSYIIPSFTLCWRDLFSNLANHRTLWHLLLIIILCGSHIGCKIRMKWRFFLESSIDNSYRDLILRRFFHISAIFASPRSLRFCHNKRRLYFSKAIHWKYMCTCKVYLQMAKWYRNIWSVFKFSH